MEVELYSFHVHDDGVDGSIDKDFLGDLPGSLRDFILESVSVERADERTIYFIVDDTSVTDEINARISRWESNKSRSETRRKNMRDKSGGRYESSDLKEILLIQENKCYYTGKGLSISPRSYDVDHIMPVARGGSSWPGNIALCSREANSEKGQMTRTMFFNHLEKIHGRKWVDSRKLICSEIDKKRLVVHKRRKRAVEKAIMDIEGKLKSIFQGEDISYRLQNDVPTLLVHATTVEFCKGFVRQRSFSKLSYYKGVVESILG